MKFIGIIPTRFGSTRFPGKPLADLCGHPVIEHVYRQASQALDNVWVATDDTRIADVVTGFGGRVVMTSTAHRCGTDRCYEAYMNVGSTADVIINIQGDEPFIDPKHIVALQDCMEAEDAPMIATLAHNVSVEYDTMNNPNRPKVVVDNDMYALGFHRTMNVNMETAQHVYMHIGIYAFRKEALANVVRLPRSAMEQQTSLEQYRWIEAGYRIKVGITAYADSIAIDTPADLERARIYYVNKLNNEISR